MSRARRKQPVAAVVGELGLDPHDSARIEHPEPDLWLDPDAYGAYTDVGASAEQELLLELKGGRWADIVDRRFRLQNPWLYRIITDHGRSLFLDYLPIEAGGRFLDVGSGWGQAAIPLSKLGHVTCLDVTRARIEILREIARQEGAALSYAVGNFLSFPFSGEQFDLVIFNGTLEWIALGAPDTSILDAQKEALARAARILRPGRHVYVGIENSLGLKYLLGAPDDHTGISNLTFLDETEACVLYSSSHEGQLRAKTWSLAEYRTLLEDAGFGDLQIYGCFPDYKVIRAMIPLEQVNSYLSDTGLPCAEHAGTDGGELSFNPLLGALYRRLARNGIAQFFCPSYALIGAKPQ